MRYFVFKTNPIAPYGWDWSEHVSDNGGGWGPVRQNRNELSPGDVILPYDLERELVFVAAVAMGGFHWDDYLANDGEPREGWFTDSITVGLHPTPLTGRELAVIKALGRVCFAPLSDAVGSAIYHRLMHAQHHVLPTMISADA